MPYHAPHSSPLRWRASSTFIFTSLLLQHLQRIACFLAVFLLLTGAPTAIAQCKLYGADANANLFTIDLTTGAGAFVGTLPIINVPMIGNTRITEIEYDMATGRAFLQFSPSTFVYQGQEFNIMTGAGIGIVVPNDMPGGNNIVYTGLEWVGATLYGTVITGGGGPVELRTLNPDTGASTLIGVTGTGPIAGLAYNPNTNVMYGIAGSSGPADLYTIDLMTGVATIVGSTGIQAGSLEFGPDGNLYAGGTGTVAPYDNQGSLYRINPATGASTLVGATGFGTGGVGNGITGLAATCPPPPPPPAFMAPTVNVQAGGHPPGVGIGDPAICLDPGGLVGLTAMVTNPNNVPLPATFMATLPGGLTALSGTCVADVAGPCTIAGNGSTVNWNGTLAAGQTVTIIYRARIGAGAGIGAEFTIQNVGAVMGAATMFDYKFSLSCPLINTRVSDQKAGSVLVFPYYTSVIGGASNTRMTISNISNAATTAANTAYVHLFFIDGTTCQQSDLFLCLTPNASFSFKASDYDPGNTGYVIAVAVNREGVPVQNNVLIGNAFVTTPTLADNYSAESFWANSFAVATVNGNTATLYFDQTGYDAVPKQFAVEIQSPAEALGQQVVTAGLSGDLTTSQLTGAAQVGSGQAFNEKEAFGSFQGWLTGACQARATISTASPRVPNTLGNLIKTGQTGWLKFNVGSAVGLLLTPRTAPWKGIRALHKTQTTATTLTIPLLVPVC